MISTKKQLIKFLTNRGFDPVPLMGLDRDQLWGILTDTIDNDPTGPIRRAA